MDLKRGTYSLNIFASVHDRQWGIFKVELLGSIQTIAALKNNNRN